MNTTSLNNEVKLCLVQDFNLVSSDLETCMNISEIKEKLKDSINYLINRDLNKLLNIFYRIDLNENKVKTILTVAPPSEIASMLADLVIEREIQKASYRLQYKSTY